MRTPRRHRVPRAVAATLFDDGSGISDRDLDALMADLDDYMRHAGPRLTFALRLAQVLVQVAPFARGRFARFSSLPYAERVAILSTMDQGAFGKPYLGLKLVLALLWFETGGKSALPPEVKRERVLEATVDLAVTRLGPEGPLPLAPGARPRGRTAA